MIEASTISLLGNPSRVAVLGIEPVERVVTNKFIKRTYITFKVGFNPINVIVKTFFRSELKFYVEKGEMVVVSGTHTQSLDFL